MLFLRALCLAALLALFARPLLAQSIVLNEVVSANRAGLLDEDGDASDWVELFNPGGAPVNLQGYRLSDDPARPARWTFGRALVPAGGRLVVFASGKDRPGYDAHWETVVDRSDTWRYTTDAAAPAADWYAAGYDDAAWPTGRSGFGYGDGDDETVVSAGTLVLFARIAFTVDDPARVREAVFHVDYDDAFVAYLNGTEIARAGIGTAGTPPGVRQPADADHEAGIYRGLAPEAFAVADPASLLRPGRNVLAVAVHNTGTSSSDLTLIPFLSLAYEAPPVPRRGAAAVLGLPAFGPPHAAFRLDAGGETLVLTAPDGTLRDSVRVPALPEDVSYGRSPDGAAAWGLFDRPTPGAPNPAGAYAGLLAAPTFDRPGGRYEAPSLVVTLEAAAGAEIRYTRDGSTPTAASPRYAGPLVLDSTTVVRARAFRQGHLPSETATETFFVGERTGLPVVSIVTEPDSLFHPTTGLYVLGPGAAPGFPYRGANFWSDREVPVDVAFYEGAAPGTGFRMGAGLQIFGGRSRALPQKPLALFARRAYGTPALRYPLFADKPLDVFESVVLRNGGNDWGVTHFRDALMHDLVRGTGVDVQAYRPVLVFLNGAYWGVHNLREKVSEHYLAANHGVNPDALDLLEVTEDAPHYAVLHGTDDAFRSVLDYLAGSSMTGDADYAYAAARLDLDNFIDYQAAQIFYANTDWPGHNVRLWRPRRVGARWKWILYDTDAGFGLATGLDGYRHATLAYATAENGGGDNPPYSTFVLRRLLRNDTFRRAFINRFADHLNATFAPAHVTARIDALAAALAPEMPRHAARWGLDADAWPRHVEALRAFARQRPDFLWGHLRDFFDLPAPAPITLDVQPAGAGAIRINRLEVDRLPWTGRYFPGLPVALTAVPRPGYRFVGWGGDAAGQASTVNIDPSTTAAVTARFAPDAAGAVVLNEILYNAPPDLPTEDWVEVHNTGLVEVDLSGWSLKDEVDTRAYVLPAGTRLAAGAFAVLCRDPAAFSQHHPGVACLGGWPFGLGNDGDRVRLFDAAGALVDFVAYDDDAPWPTAPDGEGPSLELVDPREDNAVPGAWRSSARRGGTPGRANSVATGREEAPGDPDAPWLEVPYPNPFTDTVTLRFGLPRAGRVALDAYDALGRRVATLAAGVYPPGVHTVPWHGPDLVPGLYFFRLRVAGGAGAVRSAVRLP